MSRATRSGLLAVTPPTFIRMAANITFLILPTIFFYQGDIIVLHLCKEDVVN
jgi:hypothetical protein